MSCLVRAFASTFPDGQHVPAHSHAWGQLIYAGSGVMRVRATDTLWLVPPAQAIWAPAGVRHEIWARGEFAMRTLYFAPELSSALPASCRAIEVSPLLRELVLRIVSLETLDDAEPTRRHLADVAVDLVATADTLPANLPVPADPRAARVADRLKDDPANPSELVDLARDGGSSARTMQRLFLVGTGLRFSEWRQRLRLIHAATRLGEGVSVTEASLDAGYASTSAFIAAFRKRFGRTPARMRESSAPAGRAIAAAMEVVRSEAARAEAPRHALPTHRALPEGVAMERRIGFAVLGVEDVGRSITFYRDIVGFPLVATVPAESYAEFDAGGIGLKVIGGHAPTPPLHPLFEIVVEDLDAAYAELAAKGVEFPMPPTTMPWGARMARLRDPDGYSFYVVPASR